MGTSIRYVVVPETLPANVPRRTCTVSRRASVRCARLSQRRSQHSRRRLERSGLRGRLQPDGRFSASPGPREVQDLRGGPVHVRLPVHAQASHVRLLQEGVPAEEPAEEARAVRLQDEPEERPVLLLPLPVQEHIQGEHGEAREERPRDRGAQVPLRSVQLPQQLLLLRAQAHEDVPSRAGRERGETVGGPLRGSLPVSRHGNAGDRGRCRPSRCPSARENPSRVISA